MDIIEAFAAKNRRYQGGRAADQRGGAGGG